MKLKLIGIFLLAWSCSQPIEKNYGPAKKEQISRPTIIKKPPSSFNDTVIITSKSAIFYNPDSLQMAKIKLVNEKNIYSTITHDCYYQMQNARNVIRRYWPRI